jgi:hypothetical protein
MHVSDILLECSKECARFSRECGDEKLAGELFQMSARLFQAAAHDAELVNDDEAPTQARASDISFGSD